MQHLAHAAAVVLAQRGAAPVVRWAARALLTLLLLPGLVALAHAQAENQQSPKVPSRASSAAPGPEAARVLITVVDENNVAVSRVRVRLIQPPHMFEAETDYTGAAQFAVPAGAYELRVEKVGFFAQDRTQVPITPHLSLEITLSHIQEYHEQVNVVDSPPAIDPEKTVESQQITNREIFSLPYPSTRDFRNVLPFLPGVIQDPSGQIHLGGSASYQILDIFDGFNVTQPATGLLDMRVSTDAIRRIDVQSSRYSAEYGKGSGGVLVLDTMTGDDHYRVTATNFLPGLDFHNGISLQDWSWTPRVNFSGPIKKGKAWFFEGVDGEYDKFTVVELPPGQNVTTGWRIGSVSKVQVNLTRANILTGEFLINEAGAGEVGLSQFTPLESTFSQPQSAYLAFIKDSAYLAHGFLLEFGVGVDQFHTEVLPHGDLPYFLTPNGSQGSYYLTGNSTARRVQGLANIFVPPLHWHGRHEFKVGTEISSLTYDDAVTRQPIQVLGTNDTLNRLITFSGPPSFALGNYELGGYAQDRWSATDHLLVEVGTRFDRDHIVRQWVNSPRVAASYMLRQHTKITAGIGQFYDATNLALVSRPLGGERVDQFFGPGVPAAPITSTFLPSSGPLQAPRFLNWSLGLSQKLPGAFYLEAEYMQKRGSNGFTYVNESLTADAGTFRLANTENDRYHSILITARKQFKGTYEWLGSYMRSSATSNAVIDFNLDNPTFAQQAGGPLAWDAPNRFISWGWAPLGWVPHFHLKKYDLAYSMEYHTGFPFSAVDQFQRLVGQPNTYRFPAYYTLNLHVERRFHWHGSEWALRAGFNNLTNRDNPVVVDNNIDSPEFLTFSGVLHRSFTARIRLLGRK